MIMVTDHRVTMMIRVVSCVIAGGHHLVQVQSIDAPYILLIVPIPAQSEICLYQGVNMSIMRFTSWHECVVRACVRVGKR